ncbi:MAG: aromatic ring-hydroxylating dioxygenase subunit alpha [Polyangiaceae bacterium]
MSLLPFTELELEPVLLPIEGARGLPRAAYFDAAVFEFEKARLFRTSWQYVARECELANVGDFVRSQVAGEDVLLVRGPDLEIRAFFNVCRHRGLRLVEEPCGRASRFECAYHGWVYELSGALRVAPSMPATFRRDCHALAALRVSVWHGFVFTCLDAATPSVEVALAGAPDWLRRAELSHLRLGRTTAHEVEANWKLCVENFQESHHFRRVHPALEAQTPSSSATSWSSEGAWLGGLMQLADERRTVSAAASVPERPFVVPPAERRRVADAFAFPALLTSLQPDYLLTYQLDPVSPTRTRVTAKVYFHAAAFAPALDAADVFEFWDRVNAEDKSICERQQRGLASSSFTSASYSMLEDGVLAFDRRVAELYLTALRGGAA